jgi:hypothetical protein
MAPAPSAAPVTETELADVRSFASQEPVRPASSSYTLAHETARELELRGEYTRSAELVAVALAEEAQRDNQKALQSLDLLSNPEAFKSVSVAMAGQRQLAKALCVPLLDEREEALFGGCLHSTLMRRQPRRALPRPRLALGAIAARWHLPARLVEQYWSAFVLASGGAFTLSFARSARRQHHPCTPLSRRSPRSTRRPDALACVTVSCCPGHAPPFWTVLTRRSHARSGAWP